MGRNFYSRNSCYSNCYNPCAPLCAPLCAPCGPFLGPLCPPCGPLLCPPSCYPKYECYDSCDNGKTYVIANSQDTIDLSGVVAPYTIPFQEQQDCLCEFSNNTTFIPKCNGNYKFNVSATVTAPDAGVYSIKIVVNGTAQYTYSLTFATAGTQTANFCTNLSLCKGNIVIVTLTPPTGSTFASGTLLGARVLTINKSKCGSSCCKKSCCSSSCSSSCC